MPFTSFREARVSYVAAGAGEPVALLHSSAASAGQWRSLAATLSRRYRVIAPDLSGYGYSEIPNGSGPLCLGDEAALVEQVLARELGAGNDGPLHLVGHSYGGAVALKLALRRARRGAPGAGTAPLTSLTLIEPVSFHLLWNSDPDGPGSFAEIRRLADDVTLAVGQNQPMRAMMRFVNYWNGAGTWARIGAEQRGRLADLAEKVANDFFATFAEAATLADVARIEAPTLLLCGGHSPKPMRRLFEMLGAAIPASEGVILKGAGHMAPMTHGEAVNAAIARHLDAHATARDLAA